MEGKSLADLTQERAEPRIAESLSDLVTAMDDLHPHPSNPRRGDVKAISQSLARFGQVRPVLALEDGTLVAGHHVYYAAQSLGWDRIAVVRTSMAPEEAKAYLLADNRLAELGSYADDALAEVLRDISENGSLEGTGFRQAELDRLLKSLQPEPPPTFPSFGDDIEVDYVCPKCSYSWRGKPK